MISCLNSYLSTAPLSFGFGAIAGGAALVAGGAPARRSSIESYSTTCGGELITGSARRIGASCEGTVI